MRIHRITRALLAFAASAALGPEAFAQQTSDVQYKFSGFGTIGAVMTNTDRAQFRSNNTQYTGADTTPDFGVDSRAGAQASVILDPNFTVTGQVFAARVGNKDLDPRIEWLLADYKAASWLNLRAGRMGLPAYLVSDFRNVGYAMPWLRAPVEVYSGLLYSTFDGFQAIARIPVGEGQLLIQPSYGRAKGSVDSTAGFLTDLESKPVAGLNVVFEHGNWLLRAGQVRSNLSSVAHVPTGDRRASASDHYTSAGVQYDDGHALVVAEYARRTITDGIYDSTGWYVTGGWHFGKWLPNLTVGRFDPKGQLYPSHKATDSVALGVRYDVARNLALKAQAERRSINGGTNFGAIASPSLYGQKVNLFSLAADFVF